MAYRRTWDKVKEPVAGFAGAGIGLAGTDYAAEFTARATGQIGWNKAAVKGVVKGIIGLLCFGVGLKVRGAWSIFAKVMAYAGWGGIVPDILAAQFPGGIPGLAERAAVAVRTWGRGAERVAAELRGTQATVTATGARGVPATARVGKY